MSTARITRAKWTLPRILLWTLIVVIGVTSLAVVAFARGEPIFTQHGKEHINAIWLVIASICVFAVAYRFHSAWLMAKVLTIDELRATPAITNADGHNFVKTNRWVVFGHHFAAIAGPGPLVGPVLASQFGYLPGTLWILIGATLGGAVHDSIVLFASTRRSGKSIGQMIREEVGPFAGALCLISVTAIMIIILAVLALVVVKALAHSHWSLFTILATIPLAMIMGLWMKNSKGIAAVSIFGVVGLLASVVGGRYIGGTGIDTFLTLSGTQLAWGIMGYGLLASVLPVWLLLAPRDYLSSFMKIGAVALLAIAIIFIMPPLKMPALTGFIHGGGIVLAGAVFPFCFITIACGAISGFHAIISSGTTPKLLAKESDVRVVAYGGMITEMLVGIMALIAACVMDPGEYFAINWGGDATVATASITQAGYPVTDAQMQQLAKNVGETTMIGRTGGAPTFAVGMAVMFAKVLGEGMLDLWYHFAIMFEALFILTTIDAGTRVGRFLVQDLLGYLWKPMGNASSQLGGWLASILFVGAWGWFLYQGVIDPHGGINSLWPIFGVANQLLAVTGLALGTTVLIKMGKARYAWVTILPLIWLITVTVTAGLQLIFSSNPRLGFLTMAAKYKSLITAGGTPEQISLWNSLATNCYINVCVTAAFITLVLLVVGTCANLWVKILTGRTKPILHESEYIPLTDAKA